MGPFEAGLVRISVSEEKRKYILPAQTKTALENPEPISLGPVDVGNELETRRIVLKANLIEILPDRLYLLAYKGHSALGNPVPVQTDGQTVILENPACIVVSQGREPPDDRLELGYGFGDGLLDNDAPVPETHFQTVIASQADTVSGIEIALQGPDRSGADDGYLDAAEPGKSPKRLFQLVAHHRQIRMIGIIHQGSVPIESQKEVLSF